VAAEPAAGSDTMTAMSAVSHEEHAHRGAFYLEKDGARVAEMTYRRVSEFHILIDHTEVDVELRGQGLARRLLDAAVAWARQTNTRISATCSYVRVQFTRDTSIRDVRHSE